MGPKVPRSTVLSGDEETLIVLRRRSRRADTEKNGDDVSQDPILHCYIGSSRARACQHIPFQSVCAAWS